MTDKRELKEKLNKCRREINELRRSLIQLDDQKEAWFKKKEGFSKDISRLIGQVKGSKKSRDKFTKEVKISKEKRQVLNGKIREKISEFKKLNDEKEKIKEKFGIQGDPLQIREQMDRLEFVIETEAISFEKEKKLMKEINVLKKKLGESSKVGDIWERASKVSKEIDELKKESEKFHKEVQTKAAESQEKHENVISASKEVDELRKEEEKAFKKFIELKKKFVAANNGLQEKLMGVGKLSEEVGVEKKEKEDKQQSGKRKQLKKREEEIMEKIKKGGKLTTEDLLVMQEFE